MLIATIVCAEQLAEQQEQQVAADGAKAVQKRGVYGGLGYGGYSGLGGYGGLGYGGLGYGGYPSTGVSYASTSKAVSGLLHG